MTLIFRVFPPMLGTETLLPRHTAERDPSTLLDLSVMRPYVRKLLTLIGTVRIVCGAGSMRRYGVRPSVPRLSVPA